MNSDTLFSIRTPLTIRTTSSLLYKPIAKCTGRTTSLWAKPIDTPLTVKYIVRFSASKIIPITSLATSGPFPYLIKLI
jgi:uncharacterized membrane protein